ncbi:undecaprenyl-phosphate glucose phosphotransferase [Vreelandella andesensis]|uniref:Undecaprenyl-phosphate glucose phosphotransferase n=1 Tax=Vreelandella andesensis TaxID=447567 RepID=A0A3S0XYT3_9GAMM|nr:undecaprenyl-phosphate glucose phosphotransferase [Halomonas andesensis]RUR27820.1 undecaprenyl-phosphate glucose phosphotransferase [Halomonas andesensis]
MSTSSTAFSERYPAKLVVPVVDALALVVGGVTAYWMRFDTVALHERYTLAIAIMMLLIILLNVMQGAYTRWRITRISTLLGKLLLVWLIVAILAASIIYFAHAADRYSRLWVGYTLVISFLICGLARVCAQLMLRQARRRGIARRPVFMIGPGEQLIRVAKGMRASPAEGYSIAGVSRLNGEVDAVYYQELSERVARSGAREVWICVPLEMGNVVRKILFSLRNLTAEVRFIPDFQDMQLLNHQMSEVAGRLSIDLSVTPINGMARITKRLEDIVLGSVFLIFSLPACLVIAIVLKIQSPGPILFKQYRTGVNGRCFKVYKFRSMEVHDEKSNKVTQASRGDPRVTRFGAFLRSTSLDELPQFYNVLQGRMSIVGPRPHALVHNDYYKELVESYMKRHKVKPGITGWAQVNGFRGATETIEKMEKRVEHDLWYIDNWSIWLDLRIIGLTIVKGFVNPNAY